MEKMVVKQDLDNNTLRNQWSHDFLIFRDIPVHLQRENDWKKTAQTYSPRIMI